VVELNPAPSREAMTSADDIVQLDPDHPGFRDAAYRARRNAIARLALDYQEGTPAPQVEYLPAEQQVWQTVWRELAPLHQLRAARAYHEALETVPIDRQVVPQLREVNRLLQRSSGFSMLPVAGLVSHRTFLGFMGKSVFLSTQYMRHPSVPLYTPEPDVVHELVGHAATLGHPTFAALNQAFGRAAARVSDAEPEKVGRIYWYTMEFGAVLENGEPKAYGAGLLSSFGELGRYQREATLKPIDWEEMGARPYDPTKYQDMLYVFERPFIELAGRLGDYLDSLPSA
jgi:phenylalanine-4-hydroxylase